MMIINKIKTTGGSLWLKPNNKLGLKLPKDDPILLEEVKSNKLHILEYLKSELRVTDTLTQIASKYSIDPKIIIETAAEDWAAIKDNPAVIEALADSINKKRIMKRGEIPSTYTGKGICKNCGEIAIPEDRVEDSPFLGCVWCSLNQSKN